MTEKKTDKYLRGLPFPHARALVNFVNSEDIEKEDIVQIFQEGGYIILFYYA